MSRLCEMSSSTPIRNMMVYGVGGADKLEAMSLSASDIKKEQDFNDLIKKTTERLYYKETLESVIAELKRLEADPLVRLADEEEDLRDCLTQIRDTLKKKQARGRELEAMGVTIELVRRYRKDYAETEDWGC